jgi:DNA-binding winged helix-turn-helix (wHTH) protein/Tol biopolymer transport system component
MLESHARLAANARLLGAFVATENTSAYRFGVFEFDQRTAELRKNGIKLRLQDQPRQVLVELLAHSGELVSREALRSLLWSEDTFVEFETGLNTAVKRLRDTLGDSADKPVFIETVPRKGYKFIAPVEVLARDDRKARPGDAAKHFDHKKAAVIACICFAALLLLVGRIVWRSLPRMPTVTRVVQVTRDGRPKIPMDLLITDGVHLYFVEGAPWGEGSEIAQVSAVGGETTAIVTPLREIHSIYGISPNFSELLVANGVGVVVHADPATGRAGGAAEVWAQPLPAGTPHRISNIYATAACYTPDGMQVLYADGQALITIDPDGSNRHELAKVRGVVRGLHYSPDGKRIRFHIQVFPADDSSSIWEINANGNTLHRLLPNWKQSPFQCCGTWSPDGTYYFFEAGHGNDQAIWVMPEHGFGFGGGTGTPSRLISGPLRLSAPVPSIDGKKLFVMGQQLRVEPVRYDSKTHRFESYLNGISTSSFEISPDRRWLAYVSYPDMSLWRSRMDGTDKIQLTFPPVRAYGPRWSPEGSKIVFMDIRFDSTWSVSLISSSGGPPQSFPGIDPNWLPNGRSIICTRTKADDKAPFSGIERQDLDSGKTTFIPNSEGRFSARASPDGRYIAAFSQAATELLLFDSKTNRWSSLAKGELFSYNQWSRDGKYVYMRDYHAGSPGIVRVRIQDAKMEEVVSLKDLPQVIDIFAAWIGLTPAGEPVVIRDRSTQEIYALDVQ